MRPMKKYCFLFVFLVAALSLRAQIVGDVAVTRKVLAERGGELHMVLEISVSRKGWGSAGNAWSRRRSCASGR